MCTPTATPPIWLTHGHPERMHVNEKGETMDTLMIKGSCIMKRYVRCLWVIPLLFFFIMGMGGPAQPKAELLLETNKKIHDVSEEVGYRHSYFNRIFKKYKGYTPHDFREYYDKKKIII